MKYIVEMRLENSEKKFYLKDNDTYCTSMEFANKFDTRMEGWQKVVDIIKMNISLGVKNENYYRVIRV